MEILEEINSLIEKADSTSEAYSKGAVIYSADGQDKFKINAVKNGKYEVTFEDGTTATLTDKQITNFIQNGKL